MDLKKIRNEKIIIKPVVLLGSSLIKFCCKQQKHSVFYLTEMILEGKKTKILEERLVHWRHNQAIHSQFHLRGNVCCCLRMYGARDAQRYEHAAPVQGRRVSLQKATGIRNTQASFLDVNKKPNPIRESIFFSKFQKNRN